jgi:hypothetical protein
MSYITLYTIFGDLCLRSFAGDLLTASGCASSAIHELVRVH